MATWPFFLFRKIEANNMGLYFWFLENVCRIFGFFRIQIIDKENLEKFSSYVIVSNHQSSLDLIALAKIWPENCTILAKKELKYVLPLGLLSYRSGTVYVDRKNHVKAKHTLDQLAESMIRKKIKVWVFPEGTRNPSTKLLPFKKGAFHLALQAKVPILPIVISSFQPFYSKHEKRFDTGSITIACLPPMDTTHITNGQEMNDFVDNVRSVMQSTFTNISKIKDNME